eukprot:gene24358-31174_t
MVLAGPVNELTSILTGWYRVPKAHDDATAQGSDAKGNASLAGLGGLLVAGCDSVTSNRSVQKIIESAEGLTRRSQRLLLTPGQLAPEFRESDLSPTFKANGTVDPQDADYRAHVASGFANWRLRVDGLVEHPMSLT